MGDAATGNLTAAGVKKVLRKTKKKNTGRAEAQTDAEHAERNGSQEKESKTENHWAQKKMSEPMSTTEHVSADCIWKAPAPPGW